MANVAISDLPAVTAFDTASFIEISEPDGGGGFISKKLPIDDLEITLGSTPIPLGSTVTEIAGLTLSGGTLAGTTTLPGSGQITTAGELGLGQAPTSFLHVGGTYTSGNANFTNLSAIVISSVTSTQIGLNTTPTFQPSGASIATIRGVSAIPRINNSSLGLTNLIGSLASITLDAAYSGTVGIGDAFRAIDFTVSGGSITNGTMYRASTLTNGNGASSGTITNRQFYGQGITAGAAGGTVNNRGVEITVPSGGASSGTAHNRGLYITGNGGTASGGTVNNHAIYSDSTAPSLLSGELGLAAGQALAFKTGTGARAGDATLVGGTVTVTNTTVTANTKVLLSRKTAGGTIGDLTYTLSAGASFTINSASGTDTSVITYMLVELN